MRPTTGPWQLQSFISVSGRGVSNAALLWVPRVSSKATVSILCQICPFLGDSTPQRHDCKSQALLADHLPHCIKIMRVTVFYLPQLLSRLFPSWGRIWSHSLPARISVPKWTWESWRTWLMLLCMGRDIWCLLTSFRRDSCLGFATRPKSVLYRSTLWLCFWKCFPLVIIMK